MEDQYRDLFLFKTLWLKLLEAYALIDHHIGQFLDFGFTVLEVQNDQGLISLRYTAGVPWSARLDLVVQSHDGGVMIFFINSPHKRTLSCAVVWVETFRRMYPIPPQILSKVHVQRAKTAASLFWSYPAVIWIKRSPFSFCRLHSFIRHKPGENMRPWLVVFAFRIVEHWIDIAQINWRDMPIVSRR